MSIKTILAAVALENGDEPVAMRALQLAQQYGAQLVMAHVVEDVSADGLALPPSADQGAITQILTKHATDRLRQLIGTTATEVQIVVCPGKPHDVIDVLAKQHDADLVVIGPGTARNVREKVFGSTADRVARAEGPPVLVVKSPVVEAYQHVIAAVDGSENSAAVAEAASDLALAAMLDLVYVVEIPAMFMQAMLEAGTPQQEIDRYRRAKVHNARQELRGALQANKMPKSARLRIVTGRPSEALVRLARRRTTSLIAVGARGRSRAKQLVLGSVARRVVTGASCDVLIVRPAQSPSA